MKFEISDLKSEISDLKLAGQTKTRQRNILPFELPH